MHHCIVVVFFFKFILVQCLYTEGGPGAIVSHTRALAYPALWDQLELPHHKTLLHVGRQHFPADWPAVDGQGTRLWRQPPQPSEEPQMFQRSGCAAGVKWTVMLPGRSNVAAARELSGAGEADTQPATGGVGAALEPAALQWGCVAETCWRRAADS